MKGGEYNPSPICEVVPDVAIRLHTGGGDYVLVSPNMDSIQMFPLEEYNHLRLFDPDDKLMKCVFLAGEILADLMDAGIPTTPRRTITESEHEAWIRYKEAEAHAGLDEELYHFFD